METDRLREFLVVAKHGKLTPAARELAMSPSTLSDHILALENELGGPLFERASGGLSLNEAGERNLERAQRILLEYKAMRRECSAHDGSFSTLRIPNYSFGLKPLLAVREAFQAGHPGKRVTFKTNELQMSDPFDVLAEGLSDVVCLYTVEDSGQDPYEMVPPEYEFVTVGTDRNAILTAADHPLADKPTLSVADFDGRTILASMCPLSAVVVEGIKARLALLGAEVDVMFRKLNRHSDVFATEMGEYLVSWWTEDLPNCPNDFGPNVVAHDLDFSLRTRIHLIWDPTRLDDIQRAYLGELKRAATSGQRLL